MLSLFNYPSKFAIHIVGLVDNFFTLGSTLSTPSILNVDLYLLASALSVHSLVVPINIGHHALWHVHLRFRTLIRLQYTVEVGFRAFNVNDMFSAWPMNILTRILWWSIFQMYIWHFNVTNLALEIGILSGNNRLVHHCVLDLWRATCVNYKTRKWKIIFQSLNLIRSNIFRRTTTIIILQWYGMGWDLLWVCYRACFTTELQLDEKCFSRVLLSYEK